MQTNQLTLEEVNKKGLDILYKKLGALDFIRFLQQYGNGNGDFTKERENIQNNYNLYDLIKEIKNKKSGGNSGK